jgi:hypothetical protein
MAMCSKHPFEQAAGACRSCGDEFCTSDLVHTYGPDRPPYCIPCALVAAGVKKAPAKTSTGRSRVGLLAAAGVAVAVAVPVLSHFAG